MNPHSCILCIGSNYDRDLHMTEARKALSLLFPDIRYGEEMETEAIGNEFLSPFSNQVATFHTALSSDQIRTLLKSIEKENGRSPEDKAQGIVKLDIDLLIYDTQILKPKDLEKDFVVKGIKAIQ